MTNRFVINGGHKLYGEIDNQISKNSTLPIMCASLLIEGKTILHKVPKLTDVDNMSKILRCLNSDISIDDRTYTFDNSLVRVDNLDEDLVKSMRSSLFLLGSMLARFKHATFIEPGGCKIGRRPIDIHLSAFKKMGVKVCSLADHMYFDATNAHSARIKLRLPSVGATENIIEFACLLKGKTTILNPAKEPEIVDLANFLNSCGAHIIGAGSDKICIYGVDKLHSVQYTPMYDRIVAGTLACAVAVSGGKIVIKHACTTENRKLIEKLSSMGCQINIKNDIMEISREGKLYSPHEIITGFYPDFPTDMQSNMLVTSLFALGNTIVHEKVFENRFLVAQELKKMGANIKIISPNEVRLQTSSLIGDEVEACDLRGGASLVLAGLGAKGRTIVRGVHYIDRGYESFEHILTSLGADIKRE